MRLRIFSLIALMVALLVSATVASADNQTYRVVGKDKYTVVETGPLYIYTQQTLAWKGGRLETKYFFSVGSEGAVTPLTLTNLKSAFPNNHRFHDLLDMTFTSNSSLTRYDEFHKMFKVNRLLIASTEQ